MNKADKITRYHWVLFFICFVGTVLAGAISTLMAVYLPVAVRDLLGDKNPDELNYISAYINSVFVFGGAFGGVIAGSIGDRAGRKTAVVVSIACVGFFAILTGLMPNWWGVVICRFFTGFGFGGILVTTTTVMMEEWPAKTRAIFVGILSISIPVGIFSAGAIDYVVSSWRDGFWIGLFPLLVAMLAIWMMRESKRWQEDQRKVKTSGTIEKLFGPGHRLNLVIGSLIFGTMLIGLWAIFSWLPTWIQSLLPNSDAQKERGVSMMMLGMGGLTGGFLSGWLANAMGLRRALLLCFAACSVMAFVLFKTNTVFSSVIFIEIAVLALFFGASQGILSVFIPQLFPTAIRARATGICFNTGRLVTASAVFFIGVLVVVLGGYGNALFILSWIFVLGLIVTLLSRRHQGGELDDDNAGEILNHEEVII